MAMNDKELELLERQMVERVEEQVRKKLIKRYSLISGGVLSVLALFGYDKITDYVATLDRTAKDTATEVATKAAKNAVERAVEDAAKAALDASEAADDAEKEVARANAELSALTTWRNQGQAKLDKSLDDLESSKIRIRDTLTGIDTALAGIREKLKNTEEQIDSVQTNSGNKFAAYFLSAQKFEPLITNLSAEVIRLGEEISSLKAARTATVSVPSTGGGGTGAVVVPSVPAQPPANVAIQQQQIQQSLKTLNAAPDTTIFFQFAGYATRADVKAIAARLAERGYKMPGEERIGSAAGLHEVRYFYTEDKDRAERAVNDINQVLSAQGYRAEVTLESLTDYPKTKPRRGILELWLEPARAVN